MRGVLLSLAFACVLAAAAPARTSAAVRSTMPTISASAPAYALQIPDKKIEVSVGNRDGGVAWYRNPVWIAIGVLAVIVLLLIVVLATRGGGTTVVKD